MGVEDTKIKVNIISKTGEVPKYSTGGAAGFDIKAVGGKVIILPNNTRVIPTGLFMEIPIGYEIQIRPRSGLAANHSITVLNSPGTIDCDFRGEVGIVLHNAGIEPFIVNAGDRIAQGVLAEVQQALFVETDKLSVTARGNGGFGHTGK